MNITGSFRNRGLTNAPSSYLLNDPQGAFTNGDVMNGGSTINFSNTENSRYFIFDASRSWTGETSAVGGGASHSHGIKNIAKIKKYDKIKLRNTSLKANLGLVPLWI